MCKATSSLLFHSQTIKIAPRNLRETYIGTIILLSFVKVKSCGKGYFRANIKAIKIFDMWHRILYSNDGSRKETELSTTLKQEAKRLQTYVTLGAEDAIEAVKEAIAKGMSYDLVILKDGKPVTNIPSTLAVLTAGCAIATPLRLVAIAALSAGMFAGYTFSFAKTEQPADAKG